MKNKKAVYLRLTEEINALDYLRKAHFFIWHTGKDDMAWKWAVIALHGALYGFAICACRGTNDCNVVLKNKKGVPRLIGFDEAMKNCQNQNVMNMMVNSKCLVLTESQKESIRFLKNCLRNNFEHYKPCGWSIEIHGLPGIAADILDVIRFLAIETGNCFHLSQKQKREIKSTVIESKRILKNHKLCSDV